MSRVLNSMSPIDYSRYPMTVLLAVICVTVIACSTPEQRAARETEKNRARFKRQFAELQIDTDHLKTVLEGDLQKFPQDDRQLSRPRVGVFWRSAQFSDTSGGEDSYNGGRPRISRSLGRFVFVRPINAV